MSNAALNLVFQSSCSVGLARLVLLSIADRADERGSAFCGAHDLCKRTNATRRGVFYALQELRKMGELIVLEGKGPKGCNRYQITIDQCNGFTGATVSLVQITTASSALVAPKPSLNPPSTKKRTKAKPTDQTDADFEAFWQAYPRKTAKATARKAWMKSKATRPPLAEILSAIEAQAAHWNDPRYIPHPATWINGERWNDEAAKPIAKKPKVLTSCL